MSSFLFVYFLFFDDTAQHEGIQFPDQDQTHNPCTGRAEYFFFRIYLFISFIFWLWWVFIAAYGLSLVVAMLHMDFLQLWLLGAILHCNVQAYCNSFSCCGAQVQVHRLCSIWVQQLDSQALESCLSGWGTRAQLPHSMWDLPAAGIKLTSPALAGKF